jgi:hypothetical protein
MSARRPLPAATAETSASSGSDSTLTQRMPAHTPETIARFPENVFTWLVDWSIVTIMGNTTPPRNPVTSTLHPGTRLRAALYRDKYLILLGCDGVELG